MSCATTTFCLVVNDAGDAVSYDGTAWSSPEMIDPQGGGLTSLSCPTTNFCAAVDADGEVLTYDCQQWAIPIIIDPTNALESVSCPTVRFCAAVGAAGAGSPERPADLAKGGANRLHWNRT